MISTVDQGNDITGILGYTLAVRKLSSPERVIFNGVTSLKNAAAEINATIAAAPNWRRIKNPIAHFIIAWAPDENPSLAQQFEAARRFLKRLNLIDHQWIASAHDDEKSGLRPGKNGRPFEIHVVANRVHWNGRVKKLAFSYAECERACAAIAAEMGFRPIPGRFNSLRPELDHQGLGDRVGSIRAHTGRPTVTEEIQADPQRIDALRAARAKGWGALAAEFRAQGIGLIPGARRRRADLRPGLVMVDLVEPTRRIKLSSLDTRYEQWGANHLEAELGPMPPNCRSHATSLIAVTATPAPLVAAITASQPSASAGPLQNQTIAAEIRGEPARLSKLRAARQAGNWDALLAAFAALGFVIMPGVNPARGTASGLIMVDQRDPTRRQALSALDTPTEKWGLGSLERLLGPCPRIGADPQQQEGSSPSQTASNPRNAGLPRRDTSSFDRRRVWHDFEEEKARIIARNRALPPAHRVAKSTLGDVQRREREGHYRLRGLRRRVIRTLFGYRSITASVINASADTFFNGRMRRLVEAQRHERAALSRRQASERIDLPSWSQWLRRAQIEHAARTATVARPAVPTSLECSREAAPRVSSLDETRAAVITYGVWARSWPHRPGNLEKVLGELVGETSADVAAAVATEHQRRFGDFPMTAEEKARLRHECHNLMARPENVHLAQVHEAAKEALRDYEHNKVGGRAPNASQPSRMGDAVPRDLQGTAKTAGSMPIGIKDSADRPPHEYEAEVPKTVDTVPRSERPTSTSHRLPAETDGMHFAEAANPAVRGSPAPKQGSAHDEDGSAHKNDGDVHKFVPAVQAQGNGAENVTGSGDVAAAIAQPFSQEDPVGKDQVEPGLAASGQLPEKSPSMTESAASYAADKLDRVIVKAHESDIQRVASEKKRPSLKTHEADRSVAFRLRATGRNRTEVAAALSAAWSDASEPARTRIRVAVQYAFSPRYRAVVQENPEWIEGVIQLTKDAVREFHRDSRQASSERNPVPVGSLDAPDKSLTSIDGSPNAPSIRRPKWFADEEEELLGQTVLLLMARKRWNKNTIGGLIKLSGRSQDELQATAEQACAALFGTVSAANLTAEQLETVRTSCMAAARSHGWQDLLSIVLPPDQGVGSGRQRG